MVCKETWVPLLAEPLRSRALEVAHIVAERLREPDALHGLTIVAAQQSPELSSIADSRMFIDVAIPLLYIAECFPGEGWRELAQRYVHLSTVATRQEPLIHPGFFGGICDFSFVLTSLQRYDQRYQIASDRLILQTCTLVERTIWRRDKISGVAASDYDLISGAAGILSYLISLKSSDERVMAAIQILLEYLVWLAGADQEEECPRWYIPPELLPPSHRAHNPRGNFDCGLAHGIPGPLAALSRSWLAGYRISDQLEAIAWLAEWISQHCLYDEWGINWPSVIPFDCLQDPSCCSTLRPARAGWCYGAPGISRALWLAGAALDDLTVCTLAQEAVEAVLRRPVALREIDSPTLCHGVAGLLQICTRFAHETNNKAVLQAIPILVEQILSAFNPDFPLGFRDLMYNNVAVDQPLWLIGAPGVAMALLAASTACTPAWDHILLLA